MEHGGPQRRKEEPLVTSSSLLKQDQKRIVVSERGPLCASLFRLCAPLCSIPLSVLPPVRIHLWKASKSPALSSSSSASCRRRRCCRAASERSRPRTWRRCAESRG